LRSCP